MPRQETFFSEAAKGVVIQVLKTYDQSYAREAFDCMSGEARNVLAVALEIEKNYDRADIPDPDGIDYESFLWDELRDAAREDVRQDPNLFSFFIVSETKKGKAEDLYVSPDWPSAEQFAKSRLANLA
jgi:hypothetical protein